MRKLTALVPLALLAGVMAGCSSDESTGPVIDESFVEWEEGATVEDTPKNLEARVADSLEQSAGKRPASVDCGDEDVILTDGDVVPCTITDGDSTFDVEVTVMLTSDASDYFLSTKVLD